MLIGALVVFSGLAYSAKKSAPQEQSKYAGSTSCRECHERFYGLWESSHHGLAMQPYTPEFAKANLTVQTKEIVVGKFSYQALINSDSGYVLEKGSDGQKRLPIEHVLGGKNVYYFLTMMDRGRLQTLPVAYDVNLKLWFDTAASGVRHFPGIATDEPVHWTDSLYTFNTSCYGCHVSQLKTNYDIKSDTYNTEWAEPGINCETCHGPSQEHVKVCQAAGKGNKPKDIKIISTTPFTAEQMNSMCGSCHAKLNNVSPAFKPGEKFFDHYGLVTLEDHDYYPDGRDLGENYTMTSWLMSPCVKSSELDCNYCHTSSGRYRFKDDAIANNACLPCHKLRVENAESHTRHKAGTKGSRCIDCHMPMTKFAHMNRSDHSMRPPMPSASLAFKSPNACNLCHDDKDAAWADSEVRKWHREDYQKATLDWAHLIDSARKGDWTKLDKILEYITSENREEVVVTSLIRLLRNCDSEKKWPVIIKALNTDSSPLVRAGAAEGLDGYLTDDSMRALLDAASDQYRLVRVRVAAALAGVSLDMLKDQHRKNVNSAMAEFKKAMNAHPDDYISNYNLGNFYMSQRDYDAAISSFQMAVKLRSDYLPSHVNIAFAYNAKGQNDEAEKSFRKALEIDPKSVVVHLNLAMLLAEQSRLPEAKAAFQKVLQLDPKSATAAYNLGVMNAPDKLNEAIKWCGKAYQLRPDVPKYGYTYAFYLYQNKKQPEAIDVLQSMVDQQIAYPDAYAFLGMIYQEKGQVDKALAIYQAAANNEKLSEAERKKFKEMVGIIR